MRRLAIAVFAVLSSTTAFAYQNAMWIPGWGSSLSSMQLNASALSESNPVWYGWNPDASLTLQYNGENSSMRAAMTGTRIVPTIQNLVNNSWDGTTAATMLSSASSRDAHASAIAQLAVAQAYDGIDIDYEAIPTASRANFSAFVATLAGKMHAAGKTLSVSVYAKTSDSETWTGAGAQDWVAIGQAADSVKIMAYDYHWATSAPGPITPLSWLDSVTAYAESAIAESKIIVGLPFYGYDWSGNSAAGVTYAQAMQNAQNAGVTVTHDANGEATYTYNNGRVVYFQDATSYQAKVNLLKQKHPSIAGFTAWAAGQEDPSIWTIIKGGTTVGAAPAPGDFTLSTPPAVTAFQSAPATAVVSLVAINGFAGTANVSVQVPAGFKGSATPNATTLSATTPLTINIAAGSATAPGSYSIVVQATSGSLVHSQAIQVSVVAAAPATPVMRASRIVSARGGAKAN